MRRSTILFLSAALAAGCAAAGDDDGPGVDAPGVTPASVETPCPDDATFFAEQVSKPVLQKKCVGCHRAGGLAGASRLVLSESDPKQGFAAAVALARETTNGAPTLLARPAGTFPDGHPGGTLTPPGTSGYARLSAFVDRVAHGACDANGVAACDAKAPGKRRLRRLTRREIDRALRDLFDLPATFTAGLAVDTVVGGFDNRADALTISPLVAEQLRTSAEKVAKLAAPKLGACAGPAATCAEALLKTQGRRIFRRPLTSDERARYVALYEAIEKDEPGAGAEVTLSALLQSPHFLYRSELGGDAKSGRVELTPHELATELSFLLWGTTPDAALLDAADAGTLSTREGRATEVDRLLADPRAADALDAFVSQWLDTGRLDSVSKDMATYPAFDAAMRAAMRDETRRFVDHVVREQKGSLGALLTARTTYASGPLASMYGLVPAADGTVSLEGTTRAGLLTQASVLSVHGSASGSSPIHRGKLVRERLLCQPMPPPPPSLNVQLPAVDPSLSTRERFAAHGAVEPCVGCHRKIDPIGFAFEGFDGIGAARTMDGSHPVDTRTEIVEAGTVTGTVKDAIALADRLAASPEVHACFATQWVRYGFGVDEEEELPCQTEALGATFQEGDGSVVGLLRALVESPHFVSRRADDEVSASAGGAAGAGGMAGASGAAGASGGAAGATGGTSASAGSPATTGDALTITQKVDTQWMGGECRTVSVINEGTAKSTWKVSLDVGGALSDVWNAKASAVSGTTQSFVGLEWNASLAPKASASFGFCVTK